MKMTSWFITKFDTVRIILEKNGSIRQLLLLFLWLACVKTALPDNLYDPDKFGTSRSEPIENSFFFHEGKYIESPYVVERRGLDIYINDILVKPGPKWALYDYKVEKDPGDPSPGTSPFDIAPAGLDLRDTYWSKKWRYLYSHFDHETAKNIMLETYKKTNEIKDVYWSDMEDIVCVVHRTGSKLLISLSLSGGGFALNQPSKEDLIKRVESDRASHEKELNNNVALFKKGGLSIIVGGQRAVDAIEILLSDTDDITKITALQEINVLNRGAKGKLAQWVVTDFKATPQLEKRLRILKANSVVEPILNEINEWLDGQDTGSLNSLPLPSPEGVAKTLTSQQSNNPTQPNTNNPIDDTLNAETVPPALRLSVIGLIVVGICVVIGLIWCLKRLAKTCQR